MLGEVMNNYHAYYDRNHPAASVFRARLYSAKNPSHSVSQQWYCFIILHFESLWWEMPHFIRTKSGSVCTIIIYTRNFSLISVIPKRRRQHQRRITVMWGSKHACHRACRRPAHSKFRTNVSRYGHGLVRCCRWGRRGMCVYSILWSVGYAVSW